MFQHVVRKLFKLHLIQNFADELIFSPNLSYSIGGLIFKDLEKSGEPF